jgi:hypothetical protein
MDTMSLLITKYPLGTKIKVINCPCKIGPCKPSCLGVAGVVSNEYAASHILFDVSFSSGRWCDRITDDFVAALKNKELF